MNNSAENTSAAPVKKSAAPVVILVVLLVAAVMAAAYFFLRPAQQTEQPADGPQFAPNASVGTLPGKTEEEIKAMLDQEVKESEVAFTVNTAPVFHDGTSMGNLMLESPASNINYVEFAIWRDDTQEVIYRSGLLQPNQYIAEDYLLVDLDAGTYPCTVDISLYDKETLEPKGMARAGITIKVEN